MQHATGLSAEADAALAAAGAELDAADAAADAASSDAAAAAHDGPPDGPVLAALDACVVLFALLALLAFALQPDGPVEAAPGLRALFDGLTLL